jgi:outer membrane protein TolC
MVGWVLVALIPARAQTATNAPVSGNAVQQISLADAKRLAFERNWDLLAAKSGVDAATAQLTIAKEFPNPTATLSTARIGSSESGTSLGNSLWERNYDSIAAVNQLIEIGGKRHDRQLAARAGVLGAKARFLDAKRLLDQGVTKAYVAALLANENARILCQSAAYMQHEQGIGETRFKAGDIAESDLKQIQVAAGQYILQASPWKSCWASASQKATGSQPTHSNKSSRRFHRHQNPKPTRYVPTCWRRKRICARRRRI